MYRPHLYRKSKYDLKLVPQMRHSCSCNHAPSAGRVHQERKKIPGSTSVRTKVHHEKRGSAFNLPGPGFDLNVLLKREPEPRCYGPQSSA